MFRDADELAPLGPQPSHAEILFEIRGMNSKIDSLTSIVEPIRDDMTDVKEIVGAWQAIRTGSKFLKWVGGIGAAVAGLFAAFKAGVVMIAR